MSFILFLRGFVGVLVIFSVVTYLVTHSLWTTLVNTVICAVIIQVGYFVVILAMVWREDRGKVGESARKEPAPAAAEKDRQVIR